VARGRRDHRLAAATPDEQGLLVGLEQAGTESTASV
jgi:hypothetical protein